MKPGKRLQVENMQKCIGCYSCMLACARNVYKSFSPRKSAIQVRTKGGMQTKFVANICRACQHPACAESCPEGALRPRPGGGVILKKDLCTGCGKCVEGCPTGSIGFDEEKNLPITCLHCGLCTKFCPHECLKMEEVKDNAD